MNDELPCFLSYEHTSFLLGNCGYSPTPDPVVTSIQILTISLIGVLFGGLVYFGLKSRKTRELLRNNKNE